MKVGFSLGRCVRDIVKGDVKLDEVQIIVAQTMCHNIDDLISVIDGYMFRTGYLKDLDRNQCFKVAMSLWHQCKIHQPRCLGEYPKLVSEDLVWKDLVTL
jgi:cell division FtsZ-interacting protein ZapD